MTRRILFNDVILLTSTHLAEVIITNQQIPRFNVIRHIKLSVFDDLGRNSISYSCILIIYKFIKTIIDIT